jgi:putative transcriptional regulator
MTALGKLLIKSAKEARAIARGEAAPARSHVLEELDVRAIRAATGMTQAVFARTFSIPIGTLRDWEQGRSKPEGVARAYLLVIQKMPKDVENALATAA